MKQFDSYLLFGCHLSEDLIKIILNNSSLKTFNSKISKTYNCEIIKLNVLFNENFIQQNYFLKILTNNQGSSNILKLEDINELFDEEKIKGYEELLKTLDQQVVRPYLISIPIVRYLVE